MRRHLRWLTGFVCLSLAATACTDSDSGGDDILIGVTIEQSGASRILGAAELNALRLVADDINGEGILGGRKIKLLVKDNKSDAELAKSQVTDLIDKDHVVGIIGSGTSSATLPFVEIVEQKKVPTVSPAAADAIVAKRKWTFKTGPDARGAVAVMFQDLATAGVRSVGLLAVDNAYGQNGVLAVRAATSQNGIRITKLVRYRETDKDYQTQVNEVVASQPDAILVAAIMPGAGIVAKNLKQAGFKGRVYFDAGAGAELFVAGAGEASEGMFMVHTSILAANQVTATTPGALAQKEFFSRYTQRHGTFSGYASYAADALNVMAAAISKANSTDRQKIRDTMEKMFYDGLTGSYQFSPENHGGASADGLTVLTVRKGAWVLSQ
jgi:branched-chain amino acid transport system substrate-binding protein